MTAAESAIPAFRQHRGTIFLEDADVLEVKAYPHEQFVMRLNAPLCAASAMPGSFVHIQCDEHIPMRRPLSIMRANANGAWIEILFKIVGDGLRALAGKVAGDSLSTVGPIGRGFVPSPQRPHRLLLGGGVGIPPMVFLAEALRDDSRATPPLVIMGSEIPFPFKLAKSRIATEWLDADIVSTMSLLEDWQIPARLASLSGYAGCFRGYVTDLARVWLQSLAAEKLDQCEIFACGPTPMLQAVTGLASEFGIPSQVSLEEFMACGVGGCAGCTVLVETDTGPAMKRVCVDGPVFEGNTVFLTSGS